MKYSRVKWYVSRRMERIGPPSDPSSTLGAASVEEGLSPPSGKTKREENVEGGGEEEERECYICTLSSSDDASLSSSRRQRCLPKAGTRRSMRDPLLSVCNCNDRWIHLSCQKKLVHKYGKERCDVCLADFRNLKRARTLCPFLCFWSIAMLAVLMFVGCVVGAVLITFELSFSFFPSLLLVCFGVLQLSVLKAILTPLTRFTSPYTTRTWLLRGEPFQNPIPIRETEKVTQVV